MQTQEYFQSITNEFGVLKDRVRNFIGDKHWQTDGEWKESVLRGILRRHLPSSIRVGRGFAVGDSWASPQIDILLISSESPVLYQDGDLVFVSGDAVLGVVEVKTAVDKSVDEDATKLATMSEELATHGSKAFFGLFVYEGRGINSLRVAEALQGASNGVCRRIIPFVSLGDSDFVRYLHFGPEDHFNPLNAWRTYSLPRIAPACFISELIRAVCPDRPTDFAGLHHRAQFPFPEIEEHKVRDLAFRRQVDSPH